MEAAYKAYVAELHDTVRKADENSANVNINGAQQAILASVQASRAKAAELEKEADAYVDYTAAKSDRFSAEATATYKKISIGIAIGAAVGIVIGLILGLLVSQKGIVNPIRQIVACLQALSKGDLTVAIFGADRADEVGDIGKTAQVFKDNGCAFASISISANCPDTVAERQRRSSPVGRARHPYRRHGTDRPPGPARRRNAG